MWSALDEPAVHGLLGEVDPALRDVVLADLRRTQGASWRLHTKLGPRLVVVALSWWDSVTEDETVERVPLESWLAILESCGPDRSAAAAAVHGFIRLRDLSRVLTYQRVFQAFGGGLATPMCAALAGLESPSRVFVVRWVAENAPEQGEGELVRCAGDSARGVRDAALDGLRRLGPRAIPRVAQHLGSVDAEVRRSAIGFLKAQAHPHALDPLRTALKKERSSPLRTELHKALLACGASVATGTERGEGPNETAKRTTSDALLEGIEAEPWPKLPRFVKELSHVRLRLRRGGELSEKATHWLLNRLTLERQDFADPESRALRAELVDEDCHQLSAILTDAFASRGSPSEDRWLVYQRSILGSEAQVVRGAGDLDQLVSDGGFGRATWTLDVLARHASSASLYWLDYFASSARSEAVRSSATPLLEEVRASLGPEEVQRRVDAGLPSFPFDEHGRWVMGPTKAVTLSTSGRVDYRPRKKSAFEATELAEIVVCRRTVERAARALERGMCEGRVWTRESFAAAVEGHPIRRALARSLLWLDESTGGLFHLHPRTGATRISGESLELKADAAVRIVHPLHLRGRATRAEYAELQQRQAAWGPPPFPQLDREVFMLDDYPREESGVGLSSPALGASASLRSLHRHGWMTEEDSDDTAVTTTKALPSGWRALLSHSDIDVRCLGGSRDGDSPELDETFYLESLELRGPGGESTWDAPPILFSETMRDVELAIRAGAPDS